MTTITITKAQFEALRPSLESLIEREDAIAHASETFFDGDDRQIATAYYNTWEEPKFVRFDPPLDRPQYDEDGNQIVTGN